jgi:hypothetical protein
MGWDYGLGSVRGSARWRLLLAMEGGFDGCLGNHEWEVLSPVGLVGRYCNVEEVGRSGPDSD